MLQADSIECTAASEAPGSGPVRASLRVCFEQDKATGETVLAACQQQAPLRIVRAFPLEGGGVLAHLHNVSGGLLGGDHLELSVQVGASASVQLTTTGATRLYRQRKEAPATTTVNEFTVNENALLEYAPDPLIPFAGARFYQQTVIRLAAGAGLFWWEMVAPGRVARGELFEYVGLDMKTDLVALGRPVASEHIRLEPRVRALSSLARLGRYRYFATFYICRVGLEPNFWLATERQLREVANRLSHPRQALWGVSTLVSHGLVVRCLACHGNEVSAGLRTLWREAKVLLYGCEPIPPRKVY